MQNYYLDLLSHYYFYLKKRIHIESKKSKEKKMTASTLFISDTSFLINLLGPTVAI